MAIAAVVAGGQHPRKGADLRRAREEIYAIADLGLVEAGRVLHRDRDMHAGRGRCRHVRVQTTKVVDPGGRLDR